MIDQPHPYRHRATVMGRELVDDAANFVCRAHDEVLVDCKDYGVPGAQWLKVEHIAPGTASIYPIKVRVPGRGEGQFRVAEIQGWRRPEAVARWEFWLVYNAPYPPTENLDDYAFDGGAVEAISSGAVGA